MSNHKRTGFRYSLRKEQKETLKAKRGKLNLRFIIIVHFFPSRSIAVLIMIILLHVIVWEKESCTKPYSVHI